MKNPKIVGLVSLLSLCTLVMWATWALDYIAPWTESRDLAFSIFIFGLLWLLANDYIFDKPHAESKVLAHSIISFGSAFWVSAHTFDPIIFTLPFLPELIIITPEFKILLLGILSFCMMIGALAEIFSPDKPRDEEE